MRLVGLVIILASVQHSTAQTRTTSSALAQFLPADIATQVEQLTSADLNVARKAMDRFPSPDALKQAGEQSPRLEHLAKTIQSGLNNKTTALSKKLKPQTLQFLTKIKNTLTDSMVLIKEKYDNQTDIVKEDLRKEFPRIMLFVENPTNINDAISFCGCGGKKPKDEGLIIPPAAAAFGVVGRVMVKSA